LAERPVGCGSAPIPPAGMFGGLCEGSPDVARVATLARHGEPSRSTATAPWIRHGCSCCDACCPSATSRRRRLTIWTASRPASTRRGCGDRRGSRPSLGVGVMALAPGLPLNVARPAPPRPTATAVGSVPSQPPFCRRQRTSPSQSRARARTSEPARARPSPSEPEDHELSRPAVRSASRSQASPRCSALGSTSTRTARSCARSTTVPINPPACPPPDGSLAYSLGERGGDWVFSGTGTGGWDPAPGRIEGWSKQPHDQPGWKLHRVTPATSSRPNRNDHVCWR